VTEPSVTHTPTTSALSAGLMASALMFVEDASRCSEAGGESPAFGPVLVVGQQALEVQRRDGLEQRADLEPAQRRR